jgi:hypothetical protein
MSGYKHATVTISQEEYRRLHEFDMKKKFKEFTRIKSQDSGRDSEILDLIKQVEEREKQLQSALSSIGQNSSQVDERIFQDIFEQNTMYYENLVESLKDSNSSVQDSITYLKYEFLAELEREREEYHQNLESLIARQDTYQDTEYGKMEAAQQWLNRCLIMVDFIQNQFDHERFAPGTLDRILHNLNFSQDNLAEGFSESSLLGSQQLYLELTDLRFELEQVLLKWQSEYEKSYSSIQDIIFQMSSNANISALGIQGEELSDQINLNFWTNGRYLQLLEHCRQLSGYMIQDQNLLSLEDLDRLYSQILPVIRESFESIVYEARLNALNSQLRMNIAEKALRALEMHGFTLETAGYAENDMRSQFNAHLDSPDGSQVTIQVLPTEKSAQELSNELIVITAHPYLKTEHEARLQWDELSQSLSQFNLIVSPPDLTPAPNVAEPDKKNIFQPVEQKYTRTAR